MSYDCQFAVKVDGADVFVKVGEPERCNPTYNVGRMMRAAMGFDFVQGEYYPASEMLPLFRRALAELSREPWKYRRFEPSNGWGSVEGTARDFEEWIAATEGMADSVPLPYLWWRW